MTSIRKFHNSDWSEIWTILEPEFQSGESYSFPVDISEQEAFRIWIEQPTVTFVAENGIGNISGTYYIKPNQPGQGSHVCNCGYVVAEYARGQGIASEMYRHSHQQAVSMGFRCMQYNMVVASNEGAVRLWKHHGFHIAGTLPEAFHHPKLGYVDAYVMYKKLVSDLLET